MMRRILLAGLLLLQPVALPAANVAGVDLPDRVKPQGMKQTLVLNGAGVRRKFFFRIYIGALYLPQPDSSAAAVIGSDAPSRVLMHFVYHEVSRDKLTAAWWDGFRDNLDAATLRALTPRIGKFAALFDDAREGDRIWLDYLPGQGTRVTVNGRVRGVIPGADFHRALLRIWLGDEPVAGDLKRAMLGLD